MSLPLPVDRSEMHAARADSARASIVAGDDASDRASAPSPRHPPAFYIRLWRLVRRLTVLVIGATVVLVGVVLLVTPGPAFVVIPVGLAILASEFLWARRLLRRLREQAARAAGQVSNHFSRNSRPPS